MLVNPIPCVGYTLRAARWASRNTGGLIHLMVVSGSKMVEVSSHAALPIVNFFKGGRKAQTMHPICRSISGGEFLRYGCRVKPTYRETSHIANS